MTDPFDRPAPVLIGFAEGEDDLGEFRTASGHHVSLHDLDCVDIRYEPLTRDLTLTFEALANDSFPAGTAVLRFGAAEIYEWKPQGEPVRDSVVAEHPRVRGQVDWLYSIRKHDTEFTGVMFLLNLLDLEISFFAATVEATVTEGAWPKE